jgi:GNAT superfamily N-acetyltransferase
MAGITIERVRESSSDVIDALAALLMDAVESNAGISFMSDLTTDHARVWWRELLSKSDSRTVVLAASDDDGIVGTVQLQRAWPPNQPHRADVAKLIVHRRAQGRGIARALMHEIERHARDEGLTLLMLDTCKGGAAEQLYLSLEWIPVGVVPNFALNPDGSWCDTVFFYKQLT